MQRHRGHRFTVLAIKDDYLGERSWGYAALIYLPDGGSTAIGSPDTPWAGWEFPEDAQAAGEALARCWIDVHVAKV